MTPQLKSRIENWLRDDALPLWLTAGVDRGNRGFHEALSLDTARPVDLPWRAMVQARQMYTFTVATELGLCDRGAAFEAVSAAADTLRTRFTAANGGIHHSIRPDGGVHETKQELYTQAFVIFGFAQAQALQARRENKDAALAVMGYLERERRAPGGGYTELGAGGADAYASNPHMHLYEAMLAWIEVDDDPRWKRWADDLLQLCLTRFIDADTGLLAEHFDRGWTPQRQDGRFVFEPGHQYEWSWLMGRHQILTGRDLRATRVRLFESSEAHGIFRERRAVYDQVWSDLKPKLTSSRFWPQTERIKAAVQLGRDAAAAEGLETLFKYLETPRPGLWFDTWAADGGMPPQPAKSSSFYHIIGAMSEALRAESRRG